MGRQSLNLFYERAVTRIVSICCSIHTHHRHPITTVIPPSSSFCHPYLRFKGLIVANTDSAAPLAFFHKWKGMLRRNLDAVCEKRNQAQRLFKWTS